MDLHELKKKTVRDNLKIEDSFGCILSFIDFANVNYWFEEDQYDADNNVLSDGQKLSIDIQKLKDFSDLFSIVLLNSFILLSNVTWLFICHQKSFWKITGFYETNPKSEALFKRKRISIKHAHSQT